MKCFLFLVAKATFCHPDVNPCQNDAKCMLTDEKAGAYNGYLSGFDCECKTGTGGFRCEGQ